MIFLPIHREPSAPALFIHNTFNWLNEHFSQAIHNTTLEHWLLHPHGQTYTLFLTTMIAALIWWLSLRVSADKNSQVGDLKGVEGEATTSHNAENNHESTPQDSDFQMPSLEETPIMRKLAPPDHRPINAQLGGPSSQATQSLGSRTGHLKEPGYQTTFAYQELPTRRTVFKPVQCETPKRSPSPSFSHLAKTAPETYQTLQISGMLNADGTPNKWTNPKDSGTYAKLARLALVAFSTLQSTGRLRPDDTLMKKREDEVVAYWANDLGREGGRAMLRKELDDEDFA